MVSVTTTDGPLPGVILTVEVHRCGTDCATSNVLGRATVEADGWRGSERTVNADGIAVTLAFRKTTS